MKNDPIQFFSVKQMQKIILRKFSVIVRSSCDKSHTFTTTCAYEMSEEGRRREAENGHLALHNPPAPVVQEPLLICRRFRCNGRACIGKRDDGDEGNCHGVGGLRNINGKQYVFTVNCYMLMTNLFFRNVCVVKLLIQNGE